MAWGEVALRSVPELARFEVGLHGRGDMTVGQALSFLPNADAARAALEAALAVLGRQRVSA